MTCTRAVWLLPSPAGLSQWFASGISEVSRFSCMEFPDVHGVYDYAGPPDSSRCRCWTCGLPRWVQRRRPDCKFSKLDTQPIFSPVYASLDTSQRPAQNSGPSGSLLLSRKALSSSAPCRFIPAHTHIFFPPRFEVVAEQENADGFSSHAGHQFALHRFLGYQTYGPTGAAFRRVATHHGDNPLPLAGIQHRCGAGPLLFVERRLPAALLVTMAEFPNGLRSQRNHIGNTRCADALGQLQQRQGAKDDPNLLNAATQQSGQFVLILLWNMDAQRWTTHAPSMRQNNST